MGERPKGLGKVAENGTLNENGAFYSVQDINVLLENGGGSSGGGDLPTPTIADAGSVVVVDEQGKYALGDGGSNDFYIITVNGIEPTETGEITITDTVNVTDLKNAIDSGLIPILKVIVSMTYSDAKVGEVIRTYMFTTEELTAIDGGAYAISDYNFASTLYVDAETGEVTT